MRCAVRSASAPVELGKRFLRYRQGGLGLRQTIVDAAKLRRARLRFGPQHRLLGVEAFERGGGVGRQRPLARQIGRELLEPAIEFADPLLGARFFALQRIAGNKEALQSRGGGGFRLAQGWKSGCDIGLPRRRDGLLAGALGDDADRLVLATFGVEDFGLHRGPAQVEQQRLGAADLSGNIAIARGLPGLGLERSDLRGELADDILGPGKIVLCGLEPEFCFVTARVQAGNACRLFEHAAALVGPGLDDFADAALMDQSGRPRAGRGVGEQDGDVAGAHLAAVDAEDRALLAHDAARHFKRVRLVERRRRLAVAVVDHDADFGVVARRATGVAGEDHVVHFGGAHGLVGGLAHDPTHGFDEVGLAAAVRTDHAGQAGFDLEVGGFDEGFEADQT